MHTVSYEVEYCEYPGEFIDHLKAGDRVDFEYLLELTIGQAGNPGTAIWTAWVSDTLSESRQQENIAQIVVPDSDFKWVKSVVERKIAEATKEANEKMQGKENYYREAWEIEHYDHFVGALVHFFDYEFDYELADGIPPNRAPMKAS